MSFPLDMQNQKEQWENIVRDQAEGNQNNNFYIDKAFR